MRRLLLAAAFTAFAPAAHAYTALERDESGRMLAPVTLNGSGPYRLILDTGANRTVVAPHVAEALGLDPHHAQTPLLGVVGESAARTVTIDRMSAGAFERRDVTAAIFSGYMLDEADGIIGMDAFRDKRISFHLGEGAFEVAPGGGEPPARFARIQGRLRFGALLEAPITVNGAPARAFIDTGSDVTLANDALLRMVGAARGPRNGEDVAAVIGVGGVEDSYRTRLARVTLGPLQIAQLDVYRAPLPHARDTAGEEMPALVIGMDVWRRMEEMAIDFARAELQIVLAAPASSG